MAKYISRGIKGTVVSKTAINEPAVNITIEKFEGGYVWVINAKDGDYMNYRLYKTETAALAAGKKEAVKLF